MARCGVPFPELNAPPGGRSARGRWLDSGLRKPGWPKRIPQWLPFAGTGRPRLDGTRFDAGQGWSAASKERPAASSAVSSSKNAHAGGSGLHRAVEAVCCARSGQRCHHERRRPTGSGSCGDARTGCGAVRLRLRRTFTVPHDVVGVNQTQCSSVPSTRSGR